jgi:hypothetical protein
MSEELRVNSVDSQSSLEGIGSVEGNEIRA